MPKPMITTPKPSSNFRIRRGPQGEGLSPYFKRIISPTQTLSWMVRTGRVIGGRHSGKFVVPMPDSSLIVRETEREAFDDAIAELERIGYKVEERKKYKSVRDFRGFKVPLLLESDAFLEGPQFDDDPIAAAMKKARGRIWFRGVEDQRVATFSTRPTGPAEFRTFTVAKYIFMLG